MPVISGANDWQLKANGRVHPTKGRSDLAQASAHRNAWELAAYLGYGEPEEWPVVQIGKWLYCYAGSSNPSWLHMLWPEPPVIVEAADSEHHAGCVHPREPVCLYKQFGKAC